MKLPARPPAYPVLRDRISARDRLLDVWAHLPRVGAMVEGRYRHWDTIRRMDPPEGLSSEEWWFSIKTARLSERRPIPLRDRFGNEFGYTIPDDMLRMLRLVDLEVGGTSSASGDATTPEQRDRMIRNSLEEEAITSSQLEGAATTRQVAKELIRSGRPPRDESERMIVNNFELMQRVRGLANRPMTPDVVVELQRVATEGTLTPALQGLRQPDRDDDVAVYDRNGSVVLHRPPSADELPDRLAAMCAFANTTEDAPGTFLHPALRAIALHFWLAYDHPFVDGNGRTARALFYWSMLRQGFWLVEFLPISRLIRQAPARYARSFLYTETDGNDLTYFFLSQLSVLERAAEDFRAYRARKQREMRETRALLTPASGMNHRQIALVGHALRHPGRSYTIKGHQAGHGVTYPTARKDLLDLAERGLLDQTQLQRQGRALLFTAPADLGERLRDSG